MVEQVKREIGMREKAKMMRIDLRMLFMVGESEMCGVECLGSC